MFRAFLVARGLDASTDAVHALRARVARAASAEWRARWAAYAPEHASHAAYARHLCRRDGTPAWGGELELVLLARSENATVVVHDALRGARHAYAPAGAHGGAAPAPVVHLHYDGRAHYDACVGAASSRHTG